MFDEDDTLNKAGAAKKPDIPNKNNPKPTERQNSHQHHQPMDSTNPQTIDFDNNFEYFDKIFDTLTIKIDKHSDSEHNNKKM